MTLDDEGVAGERIDAELALTIEHQAASAFEIRSSAAPAVAAGSNGPSWVITIPPGTYRDAGDGREHFTAAEARLFFGVATAPAVTRSGPDRFRVAVSGDAPAFVVVLRGNAALLRDVLSAATWSRLGRLTP